MNNEIELVKQESDEQQKCSQCRFRYTTLWRFGEAESKDLAACSHCTLELLRQRVKKYDEVTLTNK